MNGEEEPEYTEETILEEVADSIANELIEEALAEEWAIITNILNNLN